jgi:hypothetical protein
MLHIDAKYAAMLGPRLKNFSQKKQDLWNYTCPHCSDWSSKKRKARAYIYRKKNDLFTKCHHCGHGSNIGNLIKHMDEQMYKEYVLERYTSNASKFSDHRDPNVVLPPPTKQLPSIDIETEFVDQVVSTLKRVDTLPDDHPVKKYVAGRMIPKDKWNLIYFAPKFKSYVNTCIREKFIEEDGQLKGEHPRLILPFFDTHGRAFAINARAFKDEQPKYYTIKVDEDDPLKVFGIDRLDYSKKIFVVEGPIDSLFLDNCLAVAGATFDIDFVQKIKTNAVLIMDNEPRNKEIVKTIAKLIKEGYNIVLWPETVPYKDINEMVQNGMEIEDIKNIISENTFQGIRAELRFTSWKKC